MPELEAGSVDLIATDLPFACTKNAWDKPIPLPELWEQYRRLLKPTGVIALNAQQPFTSELVSSNPEWFRYEIVWDKVATTGFLDCRRRPLRQHETVLIFSPVGRHTYNPQMRTGKSHIRKCQGNRATPSYGPFKNLPNTVTDQYYPTTILRISNSPKRRGQHPTAKPVALCEYIIRTYSNPGETVLDSCMGSGSAGIAARNTGRRFIGIEQDAHWFDYAQEQIGAYAETSL